jgi:Cdc6-like AAA superfamily ATPase
VILEENKNKLLGGYDVYRDSLCQFIKQSDSSFTIGIYGKWGEGKTTLMESVFKEFNTKEKYPNITPVWFNPWRYERENNFALIPLLLEISKNIEDRGEDNKKILKRVCLGLIKTLIAITPQLAILTNPNLNSNINDLIKGISGNANSQIENTTAAAQEKSDKDLIYASLFSDLEEAVKNFTSTIVVFVDDLDRCSPKKLLEVFESIKMFLGMKNFIFVIGVDQTELQLNIEKEYKTNSERYLNTIIQLPVFLPEWKPEHIKSIIADILPEKVQNENFDDHTLGIIANVEDNPGKAKSLTNSLFFSSFLYGNSATYAEQPEEKKVGSSQINANPIKVDNLDLKMILIIQIIAYKWNDFYKSLLTCDKIKRMDVLKKLASINPENIAEINNTKKIFEDLFKFKDKDNAKRLVRKYCSETKLIKFLVVNKDILNNDPLLNRIIKKYEDKLNNSNQNNLTIPENDPRFKDFFNEVKNTDSLKAKSSKSLPSKIKGVLSKINIFSKIREKITNNKRK